MQEPSPEQRTENAPAQQKPPVPPEVLASRKACVADGVGLSHYILMDDKKK